jgi:hypothetical protein
MLESTPFTLTMISCQQKEKKSFILLLFPFHLFFSVFVSHQKRDLFEAIEDQKRATRGGSEVNLATSGIKPGNTDEQEQIDLPGMRSSNDNNNNNVRSSSSSLHSLQLSESEKEMEGAPQGPLYQAEALPFSELSELTYEDIPTEIDYKSEDVQMEGDAVVVDAVQFCVAVLHNKKDSAWHLLFAGVNLVRKLLRYHIEELTRLLVVHEGLLKGVVIGVVKAVKNLRSVLSKNALLCCAELLSASHEGMNQANALRLDVAEGSMIVSALMEALVTSNSKALRTTATEGLNKVCMVMFCYSVCLLQFSLSFSNV